MKIYEMGGGAFPYVEMYSKNSLFLGKETQSYEKKYLHPAVIRTLVVQPIA
jgi:hypothetical protein